MSFHAFGQCFRLILDTTQQKPENMLKSYLWSSRNWRQKWKLLLVRFLLPLCLGRWSKNYLFFLGHIAISLPMLNTVHFELKFSIHTNLILYFKSELICAIKFVMTSWWRTTRKIRKTISFVSSNPHIYRFSSVGRYTTNPHIYRFSSVGRYTTNPHIYRFSSVGRYTTTTHFFIICIKKSKIFER